MTGAWENEDVVGGPVTLELLGADVSQYRVQSLAVVEPLDVLEHRSLRILPGREPAKIHHGRFEFAPERLHRCVIVAVARAAHARPDRGRFGSMPFAFRQRALSGAVLPR